MPRKFRDDISNGSGVIVYNIYPDIRKTNRQTKSQQTLPKTKEPLLRYAARVVTIFGICQGIAFTESKLSVYIMAHA